VLVAFSCKRRGLCPSCGARRMCAEAAQLVDRIPWPGQARDLVLGWYADANAGLHGFLETTASSAPSTPQPASSSRGGGRSLTRFAP
jgi:hypothetical protein